MGGSGSWFKSLIRKPTTNNQVRKCLFFILFLSIKH